MTVRPAPSLAVAVCVVLVAGCAPSLPRTATPEPLPAQQPMPPAWRTDTGPTTELQAGWWRQFGDPVIDAQIEQALSRNTDLALAMARVREARSQERLARAAAWPSLDLSVGASRSRSLNAFGQPFEQTALLPQLQSSWEIDAFGRIDELISAARSGRIATEAATAATALNVAAAVASGQINLRVLDARLAILVDTLASRADSLRLARRRAEVGYTSDLELRQAEAEREATAQLIPPAQAAIARQEDALSLLAGQPPSPVPRGLALQALTLPPVPEGLPSTLLRRRPDIAQAEAQLAASDANLAAARAQFLPQIRLSASAGRTFSTLLANPVGVWSLGASVLAPIFSAGRLEAQVEGADARREQALLAYQRTVLTALREVEDSLATLQRLGEQRERLLAQRQAVADALRHAENRYQAGYSSYLEQLDAQRSLLSADLSLVQVMGDQLNALVSLNQAMGGGWDAASLSAAVARR